MYSGTKPEKRSLVCVVTSLIIGFLSAEGPHITFEGPIAANVKNATCEWCGKSRCLKIAL